MSMGGTNFTKVCIHFSKWEVDPHLVPPSSRKRCPYLLFALVHRWLASVTIQELWFIASRDLEHSELYLLDCLHTVYYSLQTA